MRTLSLYLSLLLIILYLSDLDHTTYGLTDTSPLYTHLTYQFLHGSLLHLLINLYSFLVLAFLCPTRVWQLFIAIAIAAIIPPFLLQPTPVIGFSAAIYALAGMSIMYSVRWWWLVIINLLLVASSLAFPAIATAVHAYTFLFGLFIGFFCGTRY